MKEEWQALIEADREAQREECPGCCRGCGRCGQSAAGPAAKETPPDGDQEA